MKLNRSWQTLLLTTRERKGAIMVLAVFFLVVILGILALSIDMGFLALTRTQMPCALARWPSGARPRGQQRTPRAVGAGPADVCGGRRA